MIEEAYAMEANFRMSQGHFIGCKYNGLIYLFNKSEDCNEGRTLGIPYVQDSRVCGLSYTYSTE